MKEQTSFGYRLGKVLEGKRGLVLSNPEDAIDEDESHGGGGGGGSSGGGGGGGARVAFPASPLGPAFAASPGPNHRRPVPPPCGGGDSSGGGDGGSGGGRIGVGALRAAFPASPIGPTPRLPRRPPTIAPLPSAPTSTQAKKRFDATIGVIFKEAERAFGGSTGFACEVVDSLEAAIVELERTDVPPYSVVISVFGEDKTGDDRHWWWALTEKLRALPLDRRAPLIVANLNLTRHEARRSVCLSNGVFSFISSQGELIESLNDLVGTEG